MNNFSAICVAVISFGATRFRHYLFFFIILQSIIWKSSSFYFLLCRIFLFIHDSTSLFSSTFLELQCILNGLLTKSWRNQEVEIESCPDYPRALPYSNNLPNFLHLLNHSDSKTKYALCVCNRIVSVIYAHCCLAFRRVTCRFWWKRIIDGWFIFQILS